MEIRLAGAWAINVQLSRTAIEPRDPLDGGNINRTILMAFVLVCTILMTGCASTKAYFINRGRDSLDTITVAVEKNSLGVTAQVGPLLTGLNIPITASQNSKGFGLRAGALGKYRYTEIQALIFGLKSYETVSSVSRRRKSETIQILMINLRQDLFSTKRPSAAESFGFVEFSASLGVGMRLGIHFWEIADFLLGWVGLDIANDDFAKVEQPTTSTTAPSPVPGANEIR